MKHYYVFLLFFVFSFVTNAQKTAITGIVIDSKSKVPLTGVAVVAEDNTGAVTDVNGLYILELKAGTHTIIFKYLGYATETQKITITAGQILTINVDAVATASMLDEMVISAGKFEQKMSDVTVSIQTIRPAMIENTNTNNIETIIDKTPGVSIMDEQPSIRGGSGYSYGAGSRVLLLVDDLPMLSGDAGDVKWDFAPVENIEQVEVIKGASSALYGSSALNGIINIRTAEPGNTPRTKIIINNGLYMNPARKDIIWWGATQPTFMGTQFMHSRKIGNLDLTIGGNLFSDQGYRQSNDVQRYRVNANIRYRSKKIKGLSYGVNTNAMKLKGNDFLLWLNGDTGVYRPSASFIQAKNNSRLNVDPFIVYFKDTTSRHSLRGRYYQVINNNNSGHSTRSYLYYTEYQFQKRFRRHLMMTTGLTGTYNYAIADTYGNKSHYASNEGFFVQFDKKIKKLTLSLGARYELFKMDDNKDESKPVCRAGMNYQFGKATFLRASFGQGFRYPSIAEKFVETSIGSLHIFPNDTLKPETGWSAELGLKQGFRVSSWNGYLDIAGFWTQYHNMIEFTFGEHYPDSIHNPTLNDFFNYMGFKAYNISNAQINGIDITLTGQGKFFGLPATLLMGYTYTNPTDLDVNRDSLKSHPQNNILKYRWYHSAKADFEVSYKHFSFGVSLDYHSFMINIDKAFEEPIKDPAGNPLIMNGDTTFFLPGIKEYRIKHHTGDIVFDTRISYQITEKTKVAIIVKNLFNREYEIRPGDVQPPRSIALQLAMKF